MIAAAGFTAAQSAQAHEFAPHEPAGQLRRVRSVLEVEGDLKANADGGKVKRIPLEVVGRLSYDEKSLSPAENIADPTVRFYQQAEADLKVGDHRSQSVLRDDRRLVGSQLDGLSVRLFSPSGPLTRQELDLIDIQGHSRVLNRLLPEEPIETGRQYDIPDYVLAPLLRIDGIDDATVRGKLDRMEDGVAMFTFSGSVEGQVSGVATEIQLQGKFNFDREARCVNWLAMSLREERAIGHAEPGLDVKARLRVAVKPLEDSAELKDEALAGLPLRAADAMQLLRFTSDKGDYRLLHDRRWRLMIDRHDVAILRLIDEGELIAQCNISRLPQQTSETKPTPQSFAADIQQALGENFGQVVESDQSTRDGLRVLRVAVAGTSSELPIRWIYYHIADDDGRRVALAFTLEEELLERFAAADLPMVESFEFLPEEAATAAAKSAPEKR